MIHLTIDDRPVEVSEGHSLLEACRQYDIPIPTLCYHPALRSYGACRLCMVEVRTGSRPARLYAACVTPCEEGMLVQTATQEVQRNRRLTAELLLSSMYDNPEMLQLARQLGVREIRFRLPEPSDCTLCAQCVRACEEIVGVSALSMINRGVAKKVSPTHSLGPSNCIGCGTCVLVCPARVLRFDEILAFHSAHTGASNAQDCVACAQIDFRPLAIESMPALLSMPQQASKAISGNGHRLPPQG